MASLKFGQKVKRNTLKQPSRHLPAQSNNGNTRTGCEICLKLTIKAPEQRHWCRFGVFIVNFEHISHLVLVFLILTLNMQLPAGSGLITIFVLQIV